MKNFLTIVFLFFSVMSLHGQCTLVCSSYINVSLSPAGLTTITPDMILEGDYSQCTGFTPQVSIQDQQGGNEIPTSPQVGISESGKELLAIVTDISSGNSCWGTLKIESKSVIVGITNCEGQTSSGFVMDVSVDDPNILITTNGCDAQAGSVLDFINCVGSQNNIPPNSQYELTIDGPGNYLNGVSTLDQVFIQRHILGITALDNNCRIASADLTNDGRITVFDILMLRNLILGKIQSLPNSSSWRTYNAKALDQFPVIIEPGTDLKFYQNEFPLTELDVYTVKAGDVNGSAINK
ncbi:MAG: hypothetical protein KJO29_07800 [Bacteroidia bacterium]|nr:hypothetical protein [Bacteroidia bacterium]